MVNIELDSNRLYLRKLRKHKHSASLECAILKLCSNCFLEECYKYGCIGKTSDGDCECQVDHDHA